MEEVRWDHTTIGTLAQGLEPRDWTQLELLARLTSGQQILAGMQAQTFAMAALRGTLRRRFPPLSQVGLNMKVLAYAVGLRAERFERHPAGFVGDCRRCCLGSATLALWHSLLQRVQTDVARDG